MGKVTLKDVIIKGTLEAVSKASWYTPDYYKKCKRILENPNLSLFEIECKADSILKRLP